MAVRFQYIEINGKKATLAYWARHFGIPYDTFKMRFYRHGMDLEKLLGYNDAREKNPKRLHRLVKEIL